MTGCPRGHVQWKTGCVGMELKDTDLGTGSVDSADKVMVVGEVIQGKYESVRNR